LTALVKIPKTGVRTARTGVNASNRCNPLFDTPGHGRIKLMPAEAIGTIDRTKTSSYLPQWINNECAHAHEIAVWLVTS
jgi:hypothetical protein